MYNPSKKTYIVNIGPQKIKLLIYKDTINTMKKENN